MRRNLHKPAPGHRSSAFAENALPREINDDRAEKCERNADDAQDKILPGRLERGRGPVDPDHDDGHQRREFQTHPHQADIVGEKREVHPAHHGLEHGVVIPDEAGRQVSRLDLVLDVTPAENRRGETDKRVQNDEEDIEIVEDDVTLNDRRKGEE